MLYLVVVSIHHHCIYTLPNALSFSLLCPPRSLHQRTACIRCLSGHRSPYLAHLRLCMQAPTSHRLSCRRPTLWPWRPSRPRRPALLRGQCANAAAERLLHLRGLCRPEWRRHTTCPSDPSWDPQPQRHLTPLDRICYGWALPQDGHGQH